jgi:hypothetical protein
LYPKIHSFHSNRSNLKFLMNRLFPKTLKFLMNRSILMFLMNRSNLMFPKILKCLKTLRFR